MSLCRSCQAEIRWVVTSTGKSMPIDLRPALLGNVAIRKGIAHIGRTFEKDEPRYTSHFATCVFAAEHRRAKRNVDSRESARGNRGRR